MCLRIVRELLDDVAEEAKLNEIDAEVVTIVEEFEKDSEWDKEVMKEIELNSENELVKELLELDIECRNRDIKKENALKAKEKLKKKLKSTKKEKLVKAAEMSKKITSFFKSTHRVTSDEPMELDEDILEEEVDPEHAMEVDMLTWQIRDKLEHARSMAVRKRRAALQRTKALEILARRKEERSAMTVFLEKELLDLWETEQFSTMLARLITIPGLDISATVSMDMATHNMLAVSGVFNLEEDDNILAGRFFDLSVADREEKNKIEQEHMVWKAAGEDNVETDMEQVSQPEIHAEEICDIN